MLRAGGNRLINDCRATKCVLFLVIKFFIYFCDEKINLKGISEILSEKELKNVMEGSGFGNCSTSCSGSCVTSTFAWGTVTHYCQYQGAPFNGCLCS